MMVVGEAGSGTLTRILILAKALTKHFEENIWTEMDFIEK
jgi:hypothetical protein